MNTKISKSPAVLKVGDYIKHYRFPTTTVFGETNDIVQVINAAVTYIKGNRRIDPTHYHIGLERGDMLIVCKNDSFDIAS